MGPHFAEKFMKSILEDEKERMVYTLLKYTDVSDVNSVTTNVSVLGTFTDVGSAMDFAERYSTNMSWRHSDGTFVSSKTESKDNRVIITSYVIQSAPLYED